MGLIFMSAYSLGVTSASTCSRMREKSLTSYHRSEVICEVRGHPNKTCTGRKAQMKKLRNKENKLRRKIELSLFLIDPLVKIRHVRMLTVLNRRSQHSAKLPADESEPVSVFRKHVIPHSLIYRPCMGLLTSGRIVFVKIWSRNNRRRCGHRVHSRVWKPL